MAYTRLEWEHTKKHWHGKCAYCGGNRSGKKKNLTKEHVVPESMGGEKIRHNIVPSCNRCNAEKSNHIMETWFRGQPFFDEKRLQEIYWWIAGGCYTIEVRSNRTYKRRKST